MIILQARLIDIQSPVSVPVHICCLFPTPTSRSRGPAGISCSLSIPWGHLRGLQLGTGKAAFSSPISLLSCFVKSHLPPGPFASRPRLSRRLRNSPCSSLMHFGATASASRPALKSSLGGRNVSRGGAAWMLGTAEVSRHLKWRES